MLTKDRPAKTTDAIKLPATSILVKNIAEKAFPFGQDAHRDALLLHFTGVVGGHVINARGLSLMWERSIMESLHNPPLVLLEKVQTYFPDVARAMVPEGMAKLAVAFRDEFQRDETIIRARA
jgi:hypothetical protein